MTNPTEETVADVLAEMRSESRAGNAGLGTSVEQWIVDEFADRIAAALARERKALLEVAEGVVKEADMMRGLFTDDYDDVGDNAGTDRLNALAARLRAIAGEKP